MRFLLLSNGVVILLCGPFGLILQFRVSSACTSLSSCLVSPIGMDVSQLCEVRRPPSLVETLNMEQVMMDHYYLLQLSQLLIAVTAVSYCLAPLAAWEAVSPVELLHTRQLPSYTLGSNFVLRMATVSPSVFRRGPPLAPPTSVCPFCAVLFPPMEQNPMSW